MSRYEFKLPDIGEGVTEGEVVEWHVHEGDAVREDQPLVDVMTDKATVTITSPKTGRIASLHGTKGTVVKVHSVLVVFDLSGGAAPEAALPAMVSGDQGPAATAVGDIKENLPGMGALTSTVSHTAAVTHVPAPIASARPATTATDDYHAPGGKALATPATRKLARDLGVDLALVRPSGDAGRVTKDDIRSHVAHPALLTPAPVVSAPVVSSPVVSTPAMQALAATPPPVVHALTPVPVHSPAFVHAGPRPPVVIPPLPARHGEVLEERVPFAGLRRKISERMSQSVHTAAHFTFVEECDVTALKALRARMQPKAQARGVKLSYLPFIVKAVVAALKKRPILNSALDESTQELVYRKYYNIGIAASSDAGLVVPVLKHADTRSLMDSAREIERLAADVKSGKMKLEDLQGSTFTITSLGAQGGLFATPIISFPEVAILGVHQIKQKPVVRDGQIVIGDVMLLSLSFDHRVVDGHVGAAFAYDIIGHLQDPDTLFLEA